jgi:hypothetical protein
VRFFTNDMYKLDEGMVGSAFPDCGPLAEDPATKLKRGQLNVCTVYVYVYGVLFSLRGWNLFQIGRQFLSVVDNSKVWGKWYGFAECLIFHSY